MQSSLSAFNLFTEETHQLFAESNDKLKDINSIIARIEEESRFRSKEEA